MEGSRGGQATSSTLSQESGWRPLDHGRVSELVADFKSGAYGQDTLALLGCRSASRRRPSCAPTRMKLEAYLKPEDPPIKAVAKDLGIDSMMGVRRRVTTHKKRFKKGQQRAKRLAALHIKSPTKNLRVFRAGVQSVALYGHESVGVTPKRMKWLRGVVAGFAGRKKLGPQSAACLCHGKRRLDNGLQCVAALQILTGELEESKANGEDLPVDKLPATPSSQPRTQRLQNPVN